MFTGNQIVFISPVYNYRPTIVASLLDQSHKDWRLLLLHDGPNDKRVFDVRKYVDQVNDNRIQYIETPLRLQQYGHPMRQMALQKLKSKELCPDAEFVVITNSDNYHCPVYCEWLFNAFDTNVVMSYCSQMVHNYFGYGTVPITFKRAGIDIAACMIRKHYACDIGWNSFEHSSDWIFLEQLQQKYGNMIGSQIRNFRMVQGCLVVHN